MAVFAIANMIIQSAVNSLGNNSYGSIECGFLILRFLLIMSLSSFSRVCTTFTGQNFGAGNIRRCKSVLKNCILRIWYLRHCQSFLSLFPGRMIQPFQSDTEVVSTGYIRLLWIFSAYTFSMLYENIAGYLQGFGISLVPAVLTVIGVW